MTWNDFSSFVAMGGQAAYVWGSVAGVLLMMAAETLTLVVRERDSDAHLHEEARR